MQRIDFQTIPQKYQMMINDIQNEFLKRLYSKFDYLYINLLTLKKRGNDSENNYLM